MLEAGAGPQEVLFQPSAYYNADGDCIALLASRDSFYAERVDDLLTVYHSHESGEVVGLSHLLISRLSAKEATIDNVSVLRYRKLLRVAKSSGVQAERCEV